jgi:hypothetical protein
LFVVVVVGGVLPDAAAEVGLLSLGASGRAVHAHDHVEPLSWLGLAGLRLMCEMFPHSS